MSTQTQRERFEAWAATHDLDLTPGVPGQYSDCNTDYAWIAAQHFEAAAIERCAKVCDEIAADQWSLYKGRPPYNGSEDGRANPHVEGKSDGADACADAIRALLKTEGSAG